MYKAVGESSWRDGVFSHAAPAQAYQASLNQFADGSLGAYARKVGMSGSFRDGSLGRRPLLPSLRGALGSAFRDGSLGHAYRDGSLGVDSGSATINLPNGQQVNVSSGPAYVAPPFYKKPEVLLAAGVAVGLVAYFLWKK
jgi:hypothetical protein